MNGDWGLVAGLVVAALAVGLLLWRRRTPPARRPADMPPPAAARPSVLAERAAAPGRAAPAPAPGRAAPAEPALDTQRQAATEALRQARQRKLDEATRQAAERAAQDQADAALQAQRRAAARPAAPPPPAPLQRPAAPPVVAPVVSPLSSLSPTLGPPVATPVSAPVIPPVVSSAIPPAEKVPAAAQPPAALQPSRLPRTPTVMLADDSKVVRVKTGRLLEKQGWRVLQAEDGLTALQLMEAEHVHLLITDVEMPGLDGFELTRRVRSQPQLARLPVIMVTSSDERHRAEAMAAGVNLLLGKPYAEEALLAQVRVMLETALLREASGAVLH